MTTLVAPTPAEIADRLKEARIAAGVSARELDRRAGLTQGHTSLIEAGRGVEAPTVAKLALALGISLDWLVLGFEPRKRRVLRRIASTGTEG